MSYLHLAAYILSEFANDDQKTVPAYITADRHTI